MNAMRKKGRLSVRKIICTALVCVVVILCAQKAYQWYELSRQIQEATHIKEQLTQEQQNLEDQKQSLQDPITIEKKARDELGLVKPGEVPYVR